MPVGAVQKIQEIMEIRDKLVGDGYITVWERDFVVSNAQRSEESFSLKQRKILSEIYEKVCQSPY